MRSRINKNKSITHSLTPLLQETQQPLIQYQSPQRQSKNYTPLYPKQTHYNPHKQRSRKHRLLQQKNTDIERQNRRLYERLRKIKLKNAFQSEQKLPSMQVIPQVTNFSNTLKPLSLPQVHTPHYSLNTTKSQLHGILNDRKTFVNKYFEDIRKNSKNGIKKTEELGNFRCNGWRVKVLLLDDQFIVLHGRKGTRQLTKKYNWQRVRPRIENGLEPWVQLKFQFED